MLIREKMDGVGDPALSRCPGCWSRRDAAEEDGVGACSVSVLPLLLPPLVAVAVVVVVVWVVVAARPAFDAVGL